MTHYKGEESLEKKEEAIDVCIDGLEDEDTHLSEFIVALQQFDS